MAESTSLKRILAAAALSMFVSACGGSSPSPTSPTVTPPATQTTRIIGLSGDLVFGDVAVGNTATRVLTIANTGTGILTVTGMSSPSAVASVYEASWVNGTIAPGGSQAITITFAPAAAISYDGTLTVITDGASGTNTIPLSGAGSAASRVSLAGVVTSDAGERLSGVTLRVLDGANAGRTVTTVNGDYRFDNLAVGNANLSATGGGFSELVKSVFVNGANPLSFTLVKAPTTAPYNRAEWQHWIDADGDCQDTRQEVLIKETLVAPTLDARGCRVMVGMWRDEYTGAVFTDPSDLDIDHRVPLAAAHRSGGWAWDPARKRAYANDLQDAAHLVAVSASANRSKSDRGPDEWRPPLRDSWCQYANTWRAVKQRWALSVSPQEDTALREMCP